MKSRPWFVNGLFWAALVLLLGAVFWAGLFLFAAKTSTAPKTIGHGGDVTGLQDVRSSAQLPDGAHEQAVRDTIGQMFGTFSTFTTRGEGDGYIDLPTGMKAMLIRVHNDSDSPVQIDALDSSSHVVQRIIDKQPRYWGTTFFNEELWQATSLKVTCRGKWRVKVLPVSEARLMMPDVTKGTGDTIVLFDEDTRSILVNYSGNSDFDIRMLGNESGTVLAQSHGAFSDTVKPNKAPAAIIISGEGHWSLSKQK